MAKDWKNLPNTTTPITAENLKADQTVVGNTAPTNNQDVWLKKSNNLFGTVWENGDLGSNGVPSASSQYMRTADYIVVKPSTQYTLKISASNTQIVVYYYSNSTFLNREYVQNSDTYTFTTPANCNAIKFRLNGTSLTLTNTMINEGSTALPYETFIQNQIVVDNEKYSDTLNVGTSVDSRSRVNVLKSNNLFNNTLFEAFTTTMKTISLTLKPNTQYTMSTSYLNDSVNNSGNLFITNSTNTPYTGTNNVYSGQARTITTNADGIVIIHYRDQRGEYSNEAYSYWYMLNEGSSALAYNPYDYASIYVDNEEIYSKPVVLWTNPSPTSAFAQQNITLNDAIENYSYYEVIYKGARDVDAYYNTARIPSGKGCRLIVPTYKNDFRALSSIIGTTATFGNGGFYATYGTNILTTNNDLVIPYQVIGYK